MATPDREFLLQTQGIQTHRNALRQNRSELRSNDLSCRCRHQLQMNLNRPYTNLKFNLVRDIAPVAAFNRVPNVMTVTNDVPAKTVAEFIAYVKANPGKVNMASSGNGTSVHLSGEMFMMMTGTKMQHVPYRGARHHHEHFTGQMHRG